MMWWYGEGGPGWGGWLVMILSMLVFWGLLVWAAVALMRWSRNTTGASARRNEPETPEQILARRFASGEINEEEYRSRLATLRGDQSRV